MRTSLPSVKLVIHPSTFDLLITVLENNAKNAPDEETRQNIRNLIDKRIQYTRLYPYAEGQYASVRMYESEAAETIWQLLVACAEHYVVTEKYSEQLNGG